MEVSDYDAERLRRAIGLLHWFVEGKISALKQPLAGVNRTRIRKECEDLLYLEQFAETNMKDLGL